MKNLDQYTFITALHGNEQIPLYCLSAQGIHHIAGNPRALMKNKRFIDHDLNASFFANGEGYEYERAKELLDLIPENKYVVDFHSFSTSSDPFAIIVDVEMLPLARKTGLRHIVHMKMNIKAGHALINHRKGISVEVGMHDAPQSYTTTLSILNNLVKDKEDYGVSFYEVYDTINEPGDYKNFHEYKGEFYPVLAGEKSYKFYGLKAKKIR